MKVVLAYEHFFKQAKKFSKKFNAIPIPNVFDDDDISRYCYSSMGNRLADMSNKYDHKNLYSISILGDADPIFFERKQLGITGREKYFFPIHIDMEQFWNSKYLEVPFNLPDRVKTDLQNKICKILLVMIIEGQGFSLGANAKKLKLIQTQLSLLGLDNDDIVYIDANLKTPEFLKEHNLIGLYYNKWEHINILDDAEYSTILNSIYSKQLREKKFVCLNHKPRSHRLLLTRKLIDANLQQNMTLTNPKMGLKLDIQRAKNVDLPVLLSLNLELQKSAFINITTETHYHNDNTKLFFSEKTFKPIACLQPFIMVNQPGSLKALRSLGYKTFSPWFNEQYDEIIDNNLRLNAIVNEIARLNKLSDRKLSEMLFDMRTTLVHNYQLLKYRKMHLVQESQIVHQLSDILK